MCWKFRTAQKLKTHIKFSQFGIFNPAVSFSFLLKHNETFSHKTPFLQPYFTSCSVSPFCRVMSEFCYLYLGSRCLFFVKCLHPYFMFDCNLWPPHSFCYALLVYQWNSSSSITTTNLTFFFFCSYKSGEYHSAQAA